MSQTDLNRRNIDLRPQTLGDCIEYYFAIGARGKPQSTIDTYRQRIQPFIDFFGSDCLVNSLEDHHLDLWASSLFDEREMFTNNEFRESFVQVYKPRTIQNYIRTVKLIFRWLRKRRIISSNPAEILEMPSINEEIPKYIPRQDLGILLRYLKNKSKRNFAIVLFLASTGVRAQGLTTLKTARVNLEDRFAIVTEKGSKQRVVPFSQNTADAIRLYLEEKGNRHSEFLFVSERGNNAPLSVSGLRKMIRVACKEAGLSRLYSPHAFRHFFGTESARRGGGSKWLKNVMGHADSRTTDVYIHFNVDGLREQYDSLYDGCDFIKF